MPKYIKQFLAAVTILMRVNALKYVVALVLFSLFLLTSGVVQASTVVRVDLNHVLQEAEFVFEGLVVSKETRLSPVNGAPFTYFTL